MRIIEPSTEILAFTREAEALIEAAGRTCYKSEGAIVPGESARPFVEKICNVLKHESVVEHASATVRFIVDRGVSHELVRHRLASFSQESTRYCNYGADKFGNEITVIRPCFWDGIVDVTEKDRLTSRWESAMQEAEEWYFSLLESGASAQEARSVLPNSLKTEVVMTANLREWRHVFKLRCADTAHSQMRQVMRPLHAEFCQLWPSLFKPMEHKNPGPR